MPIAKNALLIGNGINNINSNNSWNNLIDEVAKHCRIDFIIDDEKRKHFPLLYEEIFLHAARKTGIKESDLKRFIAEKVSVIKGNKLHQRIRDLKIADIITTNYEFSIEGAEPPKNEGVINERLYSVFRHFKTNTKRVWHIHGDCLNPNSINLGFEHYGGQLQYVRNYVATGTDYKSKEVSKMPFILRLERYTLNHHNSWIDLFFTTNIHIIGLSFDFVEAELWWLLTFRARKKIEKKNLIGNEITYYIPKQFEKDAKSKLDLFRATDVKVEVINKSGESFYNDIFDRMENLRS